MELTGREFEIMADREFLLTKHKISSKIQSLLKEVRHGLAQELENGEFNLPNLAVDYLRGKISKGENYLGLPYQVLDYPAAFSRENVFAFRIMFWWGHFFSVTLHLQGVPVGLYKNQIIRNISLLEKEQVYISVGATPWEYHYNSDNYKLIVAEDAKHLGSCGFIKLSKKMGLEDWKQLPGFATGFFRVLNEVLYR